MANDLDGLDDAPLNAEDRQRVRRDRHRVETLWNTFGPFAILLGVLGPVAKSMKTWLAVLTVFGALNYERLSQLLAALGAAP